jgi:hypothetical protein
VLQTITIRFLLLSFITLLSANTMAATEQTIEPGKDIFFCTKDLESLQSSPVSVTGSNHANLGTEDSMQVHFPLNNDKHNTFNLRHCFVAFARVDKRVDNIVGSILHLTEIQAYGYGGNPNPTEQEKTGGTYPEPGLDKKVVSCVPVLESSKLTDPDEIYQKWGVILQAMDSRRKVNYNTIGHNCCSVAYHAVEQAKGDTSSIDPTCFNLMGMGIVWGQTIGEATDYLTLSTLTGGALSAVSKRFSSSSDNITSGQPAENKKEEL